MTKELVTIEFRFMDKPASQHFSGYTSKTITIGVFDTFEEAAAEGNKALEIFEKHFKLNPHHNKKDRFNKTGGCFGEPKRVISNLAYLQTPFHFFAGITQLKYDDVEQTISDVLEAGKRYKKHRGSEID